MPPAVTRDSPSSGSAFQVRIRPTPTSLLYMSAEGEKRTFIFNKCVNPLFREIDFC